MRRTGELMSRSVTVAKKLNPIIPNSGPPMAAPASEAHSIDFPETWWVRVLPPVVVVVVVGCCLLVLLLVISHCLGLASLLFALLAFACFGGNNNYIVFVQEVKVRDVLF